jgi:hypothetical protein
MPPQNFKLKNRARSAHDFFVKVFVELFSKSSWGNWGRSPRGLIIKKEAFMNTWLRVNQAGYTPARKKIAVVISDTDVMGAAWSLKKDGKIVCDGELASAIKGDDVHVSQEFCFKIDFSRAKEIGEYILELDGADAQKILVNNDPYTLFAEQAIHHVKRMRSDAHTGDSAAIMYVPHGAYEDGKWKEASPSRTIDMFGGHYDAGDYIKFTLTEANLAWHLLRALEECPDIAGLAEEAIYSLDYLAKTFPDENTFVIQVGDGNDHRQGWRLPQDDKLNGKRPALCCLSRAHMGITAAALALGARVFKNSCYASKAVAIYERARKDDTQASAFERDPTNDFYHDPTDADNMALAAAELYRLAKNPTYLDDTKAYAPPPAKGVSWSALNALANCRLAELGDISAKERLFTEISRYQSENIWQLPIEGYCWGTLAICIGMANAIFLAQKFSDEKIIPPQFLGVLDYSFGCNNWGIAMMASKDLPYSIRNVYSWLCHVTDEFPTGALSEGPGNIHAHKKYSKTPENSPFEKFNTSAAVFYDNKNDFMIQESTIWGQGNIILMLALALGATTF